MKPFVLSLFIPSMLLAASIDSARRTTWQGNAGATITIRDTRSGSVIAAYSGTSSTIQNALAAAGDNTYVELGAGTFTISNALNIAQKDNVTLRGQGMSTILKFTGDGGSAWPYGGSSSPVTIAGNPAYTADATPSVTSASGGSVGVSGTNGSAGVYAQGATVLNLSAAHSFSVGDDGVLTQTNESSGSLPMAGWFGSSKTDHSGTTANGISWQGAYEDFGACIQQRFTVVGVSGNDITISPPLAHGQWKGSLSPRVYRYANGTFAVGVGLENVMIDTTSLGTENAILGIVRARNCWVKGVGFTPNATSGGDYGVAMTDCLQVTMANCWLQNFTGGGIYTTTSYGISMQGSSWCLIENNIFNAVESPMTINIGCVGNVFAYNWERNTGGEGGIDHHQPGCVYNLFEGNSILKMTGDLFHGNSMSETAFRNHCFDRGFDLQSYHRFWNILGSVIHATAVRKTIGSDGASGYDRWAGFGFRLGYNGQNASTNNFYNGSPNIGVATDDSVSTTAFLWYNYTTTGGTQSNSGEVPSSDPYLPQSVPGDNNIGDSLFYASRPGYFTITGVGTVTYPPIGPEVTGGDYESGKAYKIPAERMYDYASGVLSNFDPSLYAESAETSTITVGTLNIQ